MKFGLAGSLAIVLVLGASACGGSGEDDYCGALKKDQEIFSASGSGLELVANLPKLKVLAAAAPSDLGDEWQTVVGALEALAEAVEDAGVELADFENGSPPASLSTADRAAIAAAASEVASPDVVDAFGSIDQQARDVCHLQLGL